MSIVERLIAVVFFFKQKTAYEMLRSLVGSEMCIRDRYPYSALAHIDESRPRSAKACCQRPGLN